ncbi:MAG: macro domain-containing protein [Clostridia bacterium]|nr:macro domain-containing protein [Clostridia bacterium]
MAFEIIRNDITKVKADAIINTANPQPVVGGGTDTAVYRAAGEKRLLKSREKIGEIAPGQAAYTPAFRLKAKYIIHTVGPVWTGGGCGEREILSACYANSLALAAELNCESAAFPLIAAGAYGFPKDEALAIALKEIGAFLLTHEMRVTLVVFDEQSFALSAGLAEGIRQYIDDHAARELARGEYGETMPLPSRRHAPIMPSAARTRREKDASAFFPEREETFYGTAAQSLVEEESEKTVCAPSFTPEEAPPQYHAAAFADVGAAAPLPDVKGKSLDEVVRGTQATFQQKLFQLIDASGMDDVTVYKKANIDRKVFSRIRCREDYRPTKKTAVAFAIALKLDMPTMLDLLARAEIAFSPSSKFDLIVSYFVTNRIYDIFEINAALFRYGQPILGA